MKRNRIAAGALALALVAPVTANAASSTANEPVKFEAPVAEKAELNGRTLTKTQFETALKDASKAFNDNEAAKKTYEDADAAYKAAVDRYNKAYEAYKSYKVEKTGDNVEAQNAFDIALDSLNNKIDGEALKEKNFYLDDETGEVKIVKDNTVKADDIEEISDEDLKGKEELSSGEFDSAKEQAKQAYKEKEEAEGDISKDAAEYREFQTATYEKDRLEKERDNAKAAYDKTQAELAKANNSVKTFAEAYNVVVQMENDGSIVVKEDKDAPVKDDNKGATQAELDALRESVNEAKATIKAVEIVRSKATKISDKNKDYLDKLVAEAEKLVTKGEAVLKANEKKAAFSVFSTAYAAEEEETPASSEDVKELTDQLNSKTEEMKKAIEDVDAEEDPAEEEEKPADKEEEKPADKDEEEKPADKEEEKTPAKEEEKPAVKEDTKAKPAVKSNSNRTAGNNAKTGIAGITGVAGVLAAASVAYAASKKNN